MLPGATNENALYLGDVFQFVTPSFCNVEYTICLYNKGAVD